MHPEGHSVRDKILVVEDDSGIRAFIADVLHDEGLAVATVDNGSDAVAWLRARRPALVILDLQLPKIRGEHVLQVLRALYGGAVPVITMTAQPRSAHAMRERGAWAHLEKPFDLEEMLGAVYAYL